MIGRAPAFWSRPDSLRAALLAPIGALIGRVTLRRMAQQGVAVGVPVICVGNPTVGGAGKTPTSLMILGRLAATGARPFALLRGHGGRLAGPVRVDPALHDAASVGDEALLLAEQAPTIVARDRIAGARMAVIAGATHIIMDDGFQNPSLVKHASLLVIDGDFGVGNGRVLPAGPLRAPLVPQIERADGVLVVGSGLAGEAVGARGRAAGKVVLHGRIVPDAATITSLQGHRVLAFAGIGRPEKLAETLAGAGIEVVRLHAFPDHHPYTLSDISGLIAEADAGDLNLVTTTKDMARLGGPDFATLAARITPLPVRMAVTEPAALDGLLALAQTRGARS